MGWGPTEWRRIAALAAAFDVQLGHHEEAQVAAHLLASQPHATYVEAFAPARDPIFWGMIENRPALVDGALPLPEGPGLGWVLDETFIERTAPIVDGQPPGRRLRRLRRSLQAAPPGDPTTEPCRSRRVIDRANVSTSTKSATCSGSESRPSDTTNARSAASKTSGTSVQ